MAVVLAMVASACRSAPDTPEAQVRAWVARAEGAAEAKDASAVEELVSPRYRDEEGFDRRALMAIVMRQFMRHDSIHIFTQVRSIEIDAAKAAVVVFAAMAGQPIASPAELASVRADIFRFEIGLEEESPRAWRLVRAAWRPAELDDVQ